MKVFISWSGEQSKRIAEAMSLWLSQVIQAAEPWISSDIEKGRRWDQAIADKLQQSRVAIICLTSDNLDSKWLHFEAGAISKTKDAYVCSLLYEVDHLRVQPPLSGFQNTKFNKEDIFKLLTTINQ